MKKKFFAIVALPILLLILVACAESTTYPTTNPAEPGTASLPSAFEPPPQPIVFETISHAMAFVKTPNYSAYYEKWESAYQKMVQRFITDGYLTMVSHSVAERFNDEVTLYPEATYEDVGIAYWFVFDGISYQVLVYNTKEGQDYQLNFANEDIVDYYEKRLGVPQKYDYEYVNTNNLQMPKMMICKIDLDEGRYSADCMISDTHYIVIRTEADKAALLSFVDGLQIDSISLD